jgi:predicted RNA-binding Zn-ribbon protein involved in translation (DUF1610 family)
MDMGAPEGDGPVIYSCPMHPEVVREEPGHCPECGMKLLAAEAPSSYTCPMHPEIISDQPGHCPECGHEAAALTPRRPGRRPRARSRAPASPR